MVEAARYRCSKRRSPTVFFYCEDEGRPYLDDSYILSSFIKQLCEYILTSPSYPDEVVDVIHNFYGPQRIRPDFGDLKDIFIELFRNVPNTIYIIDGFYVLDQKHSKTLLGLIRSNRKDPGFCCSAGTRFQDTSTLIRLCPEFIIFRHQPTLCKTTRLISRQVSPIDHVQKTYG